METAAIVVISVLVAMYYGLGENLEITSRMATNELKDAERKQKERIVSGNQTLSINDEEYEKAVANIAKLDGLKI